MIPLKAIFSCFGILLIIFGLNQEVNTLECGVPIFAPNLTIFTVPGRIADRIIGGTPAKPYSWPWQAFLSIQKPSNRNSFCSGSIIAPQWIVTAAHCVNERFLKLTAQIGIHNRRKESNPNQVVAIIKHGLYNPSTNKNDIAMLKLRKPVVYNDKIQPICLPKVDQARDNPIKAVESIATGWGVFKQGPNGQVETPDELYQVKLPIRSLKTCPFKSLDIKSQICAGDPNKNTDTCQGDSGGPLVMQIKDKKLKFELVGLTSFGGSICDGNGVYTRVINYIDWIDQVMKRF